MNYCFLNFHSALSWFPIHHHTLVRIHAFNNAITTIGDHIGENVLNALNLADVIQVADVNGNKIYITVGIQYIVTDGQINTARNFNEFYDLR